MKTKLQTKRDTCQAYLVRLWRNGPDEPWRASARAVASGQETHFISLDKLFLFLERQLAEGALSDEGADPAAAV